MIIVCNGIEKETKYSNGWLSADGTENIYEDMSTDHLLNVYKHIANNFQEYVSMQIGSFPKTVTDDYYYKAVAEVKIMRLEIKIELLSRGLTDATIENHKEDTSSLMRAVGNIG